MGTARDIALIFLSLEAFVMALIPFVLIAGLAYGAFKLQQITREYLQMAHHYAQLAHEKVEQVSRAIAEPVIQLHAFASMVGAMGAKLKLMIRREL